MDKDTPMQTDTVMNNNLLKKLIRQLRFLNIMIVFFGLLSIVGAIGFGLLAIKAVDTLANTKQQITNITNPVAGNQDDLKKQLCDGTGMASAYIKSSTDICK